MFHCSKQTKTPSLADSYAYIISTLKLHTITFIFSKLPTLLKYSDKTNCSILLCFILNVFLVKDITYVAVL